MTSLATVSLYAFCAAGFRPAFLMAAVRVILLLAGDVGDLDLLGRRALRDDVDDRRADVDLGARLGHLPTDAALRDGVGVLVDLIAA